MKNQKGFIQIPLLIAIIAGVLVLGGAGYIGIKQYQSYLKERVGEQIQKESEEARLKAEKEKQLQELLATQQQELDETKKEVQKLKSQPIQSPTPRTQEIDYNNIPLRSVVRLGCTEDLLKSLAIKKQYDIDTFITGSGTIFTENGQILTNAHVVANNPKTMCFVALQEDLKQSQLADLSANVIDLDNQSDLVILKIEEDENYFKKYPFPVTSKSCKDTDLKLGDKLVVAGYPAIGGFSITLTEGIISGFDGDYIKTSAKLEHGNSGGAAFHYTGCYIGVPTKVVVGELESLGIILKFRLR